MILTEVRASRLALGKVAREFDAAALSGPDAVALVTELGKMRRLTDGMLAKAAKRVEDTKTPTRGGDRNAADQLARETGLGSGEAKRAMGTAADLEALPATDAAVRAGELSGRQADLIAATAKAVGNDPDVERELLDAAGRGMVPLRDKCIEVRARSEEQSERSTRLHAGRSFRKWTNAEGMCEGHFKVTPEVGGTIDAVIAAGTRRRFREARASGMRESQDAYAADAFADAMGHDPGGEQSEGRPDAKRSGQTVHVVIDQAALVRGHAEGDETCEIPGVGPVSADWVRSLLGTAFVTAIIKKGKDISTVAHFGRHIPAELRTAMIVGGRECAVDGCAGRDYLELDHCEVDYAKKGPTALWNLAWLCSIHHSRKSKGWHLGPPDPTTGRRPLEPPTVLVV